MYCTTLVLSITGPAGPTGPFGLKIFHTFCIELFLAPIEWGPLGFLFGHHCSVQYTSSLHSHTHIACSPLHRCANTIFLLWDIFAFCFVLCYIFHLSVYCRIDKYTARIKLMQRRDWTNGGRAPDSRVKDPISSFDKRNIYTSINTPLGPVLPLIYKNILVITRILVNFITLTHI